MPLTRRVREACPRCGRDRDVWVFEKSEPEVTKDHFTCEACGCEWTDVR